MDLDLVVPPNDALPRLPSALMRGTISIVGDEAKPATPTGRLTELAAACLRFVPELQLDSEGRPPRTAG
jgi:hypothetical protein